MKLILSKQFFIINLLSIKKITLLGFSLVALPLMVALLYSASQVTSISQQGAQAIFSVVQLNETNQKLAETLTKMERFASQYVILNDEALLKEYLKIEQSIPLLLAGFLKNEKERELQKLSQKFITLTMGTHDLLTTTSSTNLSLTTVQEKFKVLALLSQKINVQSTQLINSQAKNIKNSADDVSSVILKTLFVIPITLFIAGLFIVLITKPLKKLKRKIQRLEQGDFEEKIQVRGSTEITEIATALEVMRTRLHALELQKSSFIRHISHELKTPLAAIREGTELLYDNSVGQLNEEQQEISHIIRSSVNRLQRLIEDLLDFNIVLDSTSLQDSEELDLNEIIDNAINERLLDIKRKNIVIEKSLASLSIYSNKKQLSVILDNLLSNAVKYSPDNEVIQISSTLKNNLVVLSVSDKGPGIESAQKVQIFDAFYQGNPPKDSHIKGSGLGLTIVKELVMRLNGVITLQNTNEDAATYSNEIEKGLTIIITLPRAFRRSDNS